MDELNVPDEGIPVPNEIRIAVLGALAYGANLFIINRLTMPDTFHPTARQHIGELDQLVQTSILTLPQNLREQASGYARGLLGSLFQIAATIEAIDEKKSSTSN